MKYISSIMLLLITHWIMAQSTVTSIPNQKLINGSYVSNPDDILEATTIAQLDSLLESLEKQTTAQVAVVAIASIGDQDLFDFAQELFNNWGIGQKSNDNGLLILFVRDSHTIRFHTGYGMEAILTDALCKRIQRDFMVPEFKNGNYNAGILAGVQQVVRVLNDTAYAEELKAEEPLNTDNWTGFVIFLAMFVGPGILIAYVIKAVDGGFADSKKRSSTPYPEMRLSRWVWLGTFLGAPCLLLLFFGLSTLQNPGVWCFVALYLYFLGTLFHRLWRTRKVINRLLKRKAYTEIVDFLRKDQWYWLLMGLLFPLPFFAYFFYHLARKKLYRNHPRTCHQCEGIMRKLNDQDEDAFLSAEQLKEEELGSVDYDVWKCESCSSIEQWNYVNRSTNYVACPKCRTRAYHTSSKKTIVGATYSARGKGEMVKVCKFCGHTANTTYIIPMLESSSSDSGGGSGGSSSSGSWGGGSSGGGGASSSW